MVSGRTFIKAFLPAALPDVPVHIAFSVERNTAQALWGRVSTGMQRETSPNLLQTLWCKMFAYESKGANKRGNAAVMKEKVLGDPDVSSTCCSTCKHRFLCGR